MTKPQMKLLRYLRDFVGEHEYAPTVGEMADAMGYRSRNAAWEMLRLLERDGFVRRGAGGRPRNVLPVDVVVSHE